MKGTSGKISSWLKQHSHSFAALAAFLVYFPTLSFQFVDWDDLDNISKNSLIRHINPSALWKMLTTYHNADWMPLTWFSFALNYQFGGYDPWGYHLVNIVFHALNTALVFLLTHKVFELSRRPAAPPSPDRPAFEAWTAFLTALLFALHPIHVESVAWVTERKDVLYTFFYLASLLLYLRYTLAPNRNGALYLSSFSLFLLSLMSKTAAVSLPLALLLLDHWPLRRFQKDGWKRCWLEKIPFLAASLAVGVFSLQSHSSALVILPWPMYFLKPLHALFFYVWKMALPTDLCPIYPLPSHFSALRFFSELIPLALAAAGLTVAALVYRRRWPWFTVAWFFYLVTMAPNLAILVTPGHEEVAAADRYTYLPSLAFFVPFAAAASRLLRGKTPLRAGLAGALCLLLGGLTLRQEGFWKDSRSLWEGAWKIYPDSYEICLNRGINELNEGRLLEALQAFKAAEAAQPLGSLPYGCEGGVYFRLGRCEEAIQAFQKALALNPGDIQVRMYLCQAYVQVGKNREALLTALEAVKKDPDSAPLWNLVGIGHGLLKEYKESVEAFQKALRLDPDFPQYLFNLGNTYLDSGNKEAARACFDRALSRDPGSSQNEFQVGQTYMEEKMPHEALGYLEKAWALKPQAGTADLLAKAYQMTGQKGKAAEFAARAKALSGSMAAPTPAPVTGIP